MSLLLLKSSEEIFICPLLSICQTAAAGPPSLHTTVEHVKFALPNMSQISKTLLLLSSAFTVSVSAYSNVAPYPLTPRGLARREDFNSTVSDYIKEINTAIFAIGVIQDGQAIAECNPVYENAFTAMGFDGAYAEAFM